MGLSPYGHDHFLRFKLRSRLNSISRDDMQIMWEGGVDSLTDEEVIKACRDRGIRTLGTSKNRLRRQLKDWLDLSQKKEIPGSLMIMSRAFLYTGADGLKETLGSLPEDVIMDVKQAADAGEGTNLERLEEARRQAKLIEMESEVERRKEREDEEKRRKKEEDEAERLEVERIEADRAAKEKVEGEHVMETAASAQPSPHSISDAEATKKTEAHEAKLRAQIFDDPAEVRRIVDGESPESPAVPSEDATTQVTPQVSVGVSEPVEKDEEEIQRERETIKRILLSLGELSSESAVEKERGELRSLKAELAEAEAAVKEAGESDGSDLRGFKSVVRKLEREVERVDAVVGLRMKLLDKDTDGLMTLEECKNVMSVIAGDRDDAIVSETLQRLDADADGNISRQDLSRVLEELQDEYLVDSVETRSTEPSTSKSSSQSAGTAA